MSDQPLFQNMDEQEATYAPDQRAPGDPTHRTPTDQLGDAGGTGMSGDQGTSSRETGTGGSVTGSTNRELNDTSGHHS